MIWLAPTALVLAGFGWFIGELTERRRLRIACALAFMVGVTPAVVYVGVRAFLDASRTSLALTGAMAGWFDAAAGAVEAGERGRVHEEVLRVRLEETYEPGSAIKMLEESAERLRLK